MNYKEVLIDSQGSAVAAFTMFINQYCKFDNVMACFVEGKDCSYYGNKINKIVENNYEVIFYPCNGKKQVEIVKEMIEHNCNINKNVKFLYLVDKDYDIQQRKDGIFYTDYYSIENYYSQQETLSNILNDLLNISKYDPDYQQAIDLFLEKQEIYRLEISKVNAFAYALRKKEFVEGKKRQDFKKITFEKLLNNNSFDDFEMKNFDYEKLKELFNSESYITEEEYTTSLNQINEYNTRGKWDIKFMIWYLNCLKKIIKEGTRGFSKNPRMKIQFDQLMYIASEQSVLSESLKNYIDERKS